ncbi:Phage anti-repressor protein [Moraxella lacunata]|uniref:Phage anti-repressor protein n=1 Tax=Moraxella lacunata TaxID=477 RepID=A0A378TUI3_MORLA|nr:antA/AntB antirepressor family protein [Moraxella lacunata]STZ63934.1 Phage anti-repressor protein [Moraxella lacunata]
MTTLPQTSPLVQTFQGEINGEMQPLVNARELHAFLGSRQDFSTWIKSRIFDYDFVENQDYLLHKFMEQLPSGAKHKTDYHITLDMAKELSMVERSEKGKQARRYFIDCEKRLYQLATIGGNDPLHQINTNIQKMADGMAVLAQASQVQLRQLDRTERYINLLELNQKGSIKVTPEVIEQVKAMKADGYSQANIGRMLRISSTTVSQIVNGTYRGNSLTRDDNIARMVETAKSVLEQGE